MTVDPLNSLQSDSKTVFELTQEIKGVLEGRFSAVSVKGEISNLTSHSSGHRYFSLKDSDAVISAVMFRGSQTTLSFIPKNGDMVIAKGEINVYPPHGKYQLIVKQLLPTGIGELLLRLNALKEALQKRGWFDGSRKRPLPKMPKTIGVVTSPTGAVIQDIIHVLSRRFPSFHLILYPVKVQGMGAKEEIAQAINHFNHYQLADVLIVARGGGSLEDLFPFNEEIVAEAIFKSKIPVISAVGHETDFSISDFVADVRAPTPSAAAEMVLPERHELLRVLMKTHQKISHTVWTTLKHSTDKLVRIRKHPMLASPYSLLGLKIQRMDDFKLQLDTIGQTTIRHMQIKLQALEKALKAQRPDLKLAVIKERLAAFQKNVTQAFLKSLDLKEERLLFINKTLHTKVCSTLHILQTKYNQANFPKRLDLYSLSSLRQKKEGLEALNQALMALHPKKVLSRGYAILFDENKRQVITSVGDLTPGKKVRAELVDGEALLEVLPPDLERQSTRK